MLQKISIYILKLIGWKLENKLPAEKKHLIIGAFHTSNWDLLLALLCFSAMKLKFNWIGKHTLFRWPFGLLFKAIGGIPVNRSIQTGFIHRIAELYHNNNALIIAMSPEGTRSKTEHWRTGFYYIALEANIPIALAYVNYPEKKAGIGKYFMPSGNIQQDLEIIKKYYASKKGKYPDKQGDIKIKIQ
jgi:1-acyl-sn-glycerol-3-phosphate acyltransferase